MANQTLIDIESVRCRLKAIENDLVLIEEALKRIEERQGRNP